MNFGDYLNSFAQTAGNVYGVLQANKQPGTVSAPAAAPASNAWKTWLPLGIGAAVLLVIVALIARKG